MNTNTNTTEKPIVKFFRSYESMTRYCNYRYGKKRATEMLDAPRHYHTSPYSGITRGYGAAYWFNTKNGKVGFEQSKADAAYAPLTDEDRASWGHNTYKPAHLPAIDADQLAERRMEEMAAYIHSGAGLENYYEDREAGYAY